MRRKSLLIALVMIAAWVPVFATPAPSVQPPQYDLRIERQSLSSALQEFAKQSGVQIIFFSRVTDGHEAASLSGRFTAVAALARLLNDAPELAFRELNANTIEVLPKEAVNRLDSAYASATLGGGTGEAFPTEGEGKAKGFWSRFRVAQSEPPTTPGSNASTTATSAEGSATNPRHLEEVLVTAQKREERLKDVPIAISVLTGESLDRSNGGIAEQLNRVPGVFTAQNPNGGATWLSIRGVAATGTLSQGASPIAYYMDSVPFGLVRSATVPDVNAYDLERVEVLRGPQGTLYGASALNGVVRILTQDANPDTFEVKARASFSGTHGGGENYRGDLALNAPIVSGKLAARLVTGYESLGGWIDRPNWEDANDGITRNARVKIAGHPTDALSIGLSAWISRSDLDAPSTAPVPEQTPSPLREPSFTDYDLYGARIAYEFAPVSVSSVTSYLDYANGGTLDFTTLGFPGRLLSTNLSATLLSEEVVVNSRGSDTWRWSLGGIYRDAEDLQFQDFNQAGALPAPVDVTSTSQSHAIYGQLTRVLMEGAVELTAGLRYFEDDVGQHENISQTGNPATPLVRSKRKFHATSPRAAVTWHANDETTIYGSYSEGFRSGYDQLPVTLLVDPTFRPVEPETLKNYELGAKGSIADGVVSYDSAIYYIDWQDVIQTLSVPNPATGPIFGTINGPSASGLGAELALSVQLPSDFDFGLSVAWNDLQMDTAVVNASGAVLFRKGDRLNTSPEYTAAMSAGYKFALGRGGYSGRISAGANYTSELCAATVTRRFCGDTILTGRTALVIESPQHWSATLFVENVSNEQGVVLPNSIQVRNARIRPRTVGFQAEYRFH